MTSYLGVPGGSRGGTAQPKRLRTIGLTGGVGCGKSTVAREFAALGAHIIDMDALSRAVLTHDTEAIEIVVEHFGPKIVDAAGVIDRDALGRVVFADQVAREYLERVVLTRVEVAVAAATARIADEVGSQAVIVHDSPLLVERGAAAAYDAVVVVQTPLEIRLRRLDARGWSREKSAAVMAAQASDAERAAVATHLIDNAGSRDELAQAVERVWRAFTC